MTPDPAETLTLLPESTPVLRFVYTSVEHGHRAGLEPDCAVFLLGPDYPNCSMVLNWIGPGLTLHRLGYWISPFE